MAIQLTLLKNLGFTQIVTAAAVSVTAITSAWGQPMPASGAIKTVLEGCRVCTDPDLAGDCETILAGESKDLTKDDKLKEKVSSIELASGYSLKYSTWGTNGGERGIIYLDGMSYQSTDNRNLTPQHKLDTNDDFDTVTCEYFGNYMAVLYKDRYLAGGRLYLGSIPIDHPMELAIWNLKDQISSLSLKPNTRLNYWTWNRDKNSIGMINRNANGGYSSSEGDGDDTPEKWLSTNDNFDYVSVEQIVSE